MDIDMQYGHGPSHVAWTWTYSMDIDLQRGHGPAWTRTCGMDMDMDMQHGHGHAAWTSSYHICMFMFMSMPPYAACPRP